MNGSHLKVANLGNHLRDLAAQQIHVCAAHSWDVIAENRSSWRLSACSFRCIASIDSDLSSTIARIIPKATTSWERSTVQLVRSLPGRGGQSAFRWEKRAPGEEADNNGQCARRNAPVIPGRQRLRAKQIQDPVIRSIPRQRNHTRQPASPKEKQLQSVPLSRRDIAKVSCDPKEKKAPLPKHASRHSTKSRRMCVIAVQHSISDRRYSRQQSSRFLLARLPPRGN